MAKNILKQEEIYHDNIAQQFSLQRKYDYIWEVPELLFLLKRKYFQDKSVVEMGCGSSFVISKFCKNLNIKLKNYIGVDISKKMISLAKKNYPKGFFVNKDIAHTDLPVSSIDTILSLGSLHHAENKYITLSHWIQILKSDGFLLLREPTIEGLKFGSGASPTEEGINVNDVCYFLKKGKLLIHRKIFFCSSFFHTINRILIKILGNFWLKNEFLWYPVMIFDIFISNTVGCYVSFLRGDACIIIAQKL